MVGLGGCLRCAAFSHEQEDCWLSRNCRIRDSDGTACGACHITELHGGDHSTMPPLGNSVAYLTTSAVATPAATPADADPDASCIVIASQDQGHKVTTWPLLDRETERTT